MTVGELIRLLDRHAKSLEVRVGGNDDPVGLAFPVLGAQEITITMQRDLPGEGTRLYEEPTFLAIMHAGRGRSD